MQITFLMSTYALNHKEDLPRSYLCIIWSAVPPKNNVALKHCFCVNIQKLKQSKKFQNPINTVQTKMKKEYVFENVQSYKPPF